LGHHLIRRDAIARTYRALDDPAADSEGESDFLFGLNLTCKDNRSAQAALFNDDRADGTRRRRLLGDLAFATGKYQGEHRRGHEKQSGKTMEERRVTG